MCFHHHVETFCTVYSWCCNLVKIKGDKRWVKIPSVLQDSCGQPILSCIAFRSPEKLKNNKKAPLAFSKDNILSFSQVLIKFSHSCHQKVAECTTQEKNSKAMGVQPLHSNETDLSLSFFMPRMPPGSSGTVWALLLGWKWRCILFFYFWETLSISGLQRQKGTFRVLSSRMMKC